MEPAEGRRARTTRLRRKRILAAARELFEQHGYDAATTADIAERADISHATLFRYAATKSELLLMVGNEWFRAALDDGIRRAATASAVTERLHALLSPIVEGRHGLANIAVYQRHAAASRTEDCHAARARELVEELVTHVADAFRAAAPDASEALHESAARAVYAVLHLAILEAGLDGTALETLLAPQLDIVIRGHLAAASEEEGRQV